MANLWDNMDEGQRSQLCKAFATEQGMKYDSTNSSRAKEQLAANPNLVARLAKENGLVDEEQDVLQEEGGEEGNEITRNVAAAMEDSVGDDQATGGLSQGNIPPQKQGESLEDYIARLTALSEGNTELGAMGV